MARPSFAWAGFSAGGRTLTWEEVISAIELKSLTDEHPPPKQSLDGPPSGVGWTRSLGHAPFASHKIPTPRAASKTTIDREIKACVIMPSFAPRESTAVSAGENAALVLKAKKR